MGYLGAIAVKRRKCYLQSRNHVGCRLAMPQTYTILGLESSCDDTAAAILRGSSNGPAEILSSVVWGQDGLHAAFGGVVPEIAARAHAERLDLCVEQALEQAEPRLGYPCSQSPSESFVGRLSDRPVRLKGQPHVYDAARAKPPECSKPGRRSTQCV